MTAEQSRPDGDHRDSTRMRTAAAMLRRRQDLPTIAEHTGVPVPLLEQLLAEQQTRPRRRLHRRGAPKVTLPMIVRVLALDFLAFCALIVSITALIERRLNIGLISAAAAIVLIIGVWRLVRRSRLPGPPKVRRRT